MKAGQKASFRDLDVGMSNINAVQVPFGMQDQACSGADTLCYKPSAMRRRTVVGNNFSADSLCSDALAPALALVPNRSN